MHFSQSFPIRNKAFLLKCRGRTKKRPCWDFKTQQLLSPTAIDEFDKRYFSSFLEFFLDLSAGTVWMLLEE